MRLINRNVEQFAVETIEKMEQGDQVSPDGVRAIVEMAKVGVRFSGERDALVTLMARAVRLLNDAAEHFRLSVMPLSAQQAKVCADALAEVINGIGIDSTPRSELVGMLTEAACEFRRREGLVTKSIQAHPGDGGPVQAMSLPPLEALQSERRKVQDIATRIEALIAGEAQSDTEVEHQDSEILGANGSENAKMDENDLGVREGADGSPGASVSERPSCVEGIRNILRLLETNGATSVTLPVASLVALANDGDDNEPFEIWYNHEGIPDDVRTLVIAAREGWEALIEYVGSGDEIAAALDRALEAFASRVPFDGEPQCSETVEGADCWAKDCPEHGYPRLFEADASCVTTIEAASGVFRSPPADLQARVDKWMDACFGEPIKSDQLERADRFTEEALELAQTMPGFNAERAHALVDYVFGRPVGERAQEVGGVMVCIAALCNTVGLSIDECADAEVARIWTKVEAIRAKQAAKPTGSALPVPPADPWGPEIAVNGVRPAWLGDDLVSARGKCTGTWYSPARLGDYGGDDLAWVQCDAIRLPADHWAYPVIAKGFEPWLGGDAAPNDWDSSQPVLMDTNVNPERYGDRWNWSAKPKHPMGNELCRIIGYRRAKPLDLPEFRDPGVAGKAMNPDGKLRTAPRDLPAPDFSDPTEKARSLAKERNYKFWPGGDAEPGDYGGTEVLLRDGSIAKSANFANWTHCGSAVDIIGYTEIPF